MLRQFTKYLDLFSISLIHLKREFEVIFVNHSISRSSDVFGD